MIRPQLRPVVIEQDHAAMPCASCGARVHSVCSAIDEHDLGRLAALAHRTEVPAGKTFVQEGDPADNFFNITAGTARLFKELPDGRRQIVGFAGTGYFLGLAVSDTYAFTAEAIEPVRYCQFSRAKLKTLLDDFPAMEQRLLNVAANELVAAQEQMLLLGCKTAIERIASFLLAQSVLGVPCGQPRDNLSLKMSRGDIADYLGMRIETVSRALHRLRTEKLIELQTISDVVIRDRAGLEALASDGSVAAGRRAAR
jgi:CRP/FNR family transcriptional regulator